MGFLFEPLLMFAGGAAMSGFFGGNDRRRQEQIVIPPPPQTIIEPTPPPRAPLTASQTAARSRAHATAGANQFTQTTLTTAAQREDQNALIRRKTLLGG